VTNFKRIISADNPRYKQLKRLALSARERRKQGQTLLDGVHLLHALAEAEGSPALLVLRQGDEIKDGSELQHCLSHFAHVGGIVLNSALFDALSPVETPTGVMALYDIAPQQPQQEQCVVLLENIQDPGNLGSILRTAAAAGVDAVYLSKGCAEAWSPKTLRAAMGAHFIIPIFEQQPLEQVCSRFPTVIAATLEAEDSLYGLNLRGRVAFLFGNEGAGLSRSLAKRANQTIKIPMPGGIESLNVAAATAICLFERVRQTSAQAPID